MTAKTKPKVHLTPHGPAHGENLKHYDKAIFAWKAHEYVRPARGKIWYLGAILAVMFLLGLALMGNNWTMALAILAFSGVYYYLHIHQHPRDIDVVISEFGIKVGSMVFPFSHIQSFWIIYQPPFVKTLSLRVEKRSIDVVIQLEDQDPVPVRQFLCTQIPELEGKNESFADIVLRLLKL